ncbi:MAG: APC family permease [Candidatus Omnitrophica bacterium]|nr:APC family permease [Candidatus Omnitrophota bacterium]
MSLIQRLKNIIIGKSRDPQDSAIFHKLSLIAFFAWIGLGADGLSSSCYGPQEAFLALGTHTYLSIFVALGTVLTIFVISTSYSQIIELFPGGGGGYLVGSKLLSPTLGMVSGCALLIDYVLTIAISIASGADALFSFMPLGLYAYRLSFAIMAVLVLMVLNMRGIKESVLVLTPIFLTFIVTHVFIIFYSLFKHPAGSGTLIASTASEVHNTVSSLGLWGTIFLILKAYSMGAGTFTGIEAVSNSTSVLREPKVETAKKTMRYMAISLSFVVLGLMIAYLFYQVVLEPGKTLNATLFEQVTSGWGKSGYVFVLVALISEATLLFVAAQTGFLGGPAVLANMANDRWFPNRFSALSDRLVTQNGILIMGGLALLVMVITGGSVKLLVVLYSINVFITFCFSQAGMVRHWWQVRSQVKGWKKKFFINGTGFILCAFILASMIIMKFSEGGWITLFFTGSLIVVAILVKRHYYQTAKLLHRLNNLVTVAESAEEALLNPAINVTPETKPDLRSKTAVLLVSGFNGIGLHTLFGIIRLFGGVFKNFVFVQIGIIDAGNFKGTSEVGRLETDAKTDITRYVKFMNKQGFYAEGLFEVGTDVVEEVSNIAPQILKRFPNSVFFGGQLIFPKDSFAIRFLHNYTVFAMQKKLYREGIPFVILPIRV